MSPQAMQMMYYNAQQQHMAAAASTNSYGYGGYGYLVSDFPPENLPIC